MNKRCRLHGPNNSHDTDQCKVIGDQADKMRAQWQARPSYDNKYKKKFNPTRRMDGRPPQANLVEQKTIPRKGRNKREAVLMFEKHEANDNSLEMENFNYNRDKHSLIDENEFIPDDLSDLDPTFVTEVCESLDEDH
jgi:hypothetical protein